MATANFEFIQEIYHDLQRKGYNIKIEYAGAFALVLVNGEVVLKTTNERELYGFIGGFNIGTQV